MYLYMYIHAYNHKERRTDRSLRKSKFNKSGVELLRKLSKGSPRNVNEDQIKGHNMLVEGHMCRYTIERHILCW